MDFVELWALCTSLYTVFFCLLPVGLCVEWYHRDSSDGFSAINLLFPILVMACWIRYGILIADTPTIVVNGVCVALFTMYVFVYDYFQRDKKYLHCQIAGATVTFMSIYFYIDNAPTDDQGKMMGAVCAVVQTASMSGVVYECYRVIQTLKTTEYLPAFITYGNLIMGAMWFALGVMIADPFLLIANAAVVLANGVVIALYYVYPPITWKVPLIGTGPTMKTESSKKTD